MANSGTVVAGLRSPRALILDLVPSEDVPDLSLVTAASLKVWRARDVVQTWTCEMSDKTAETLTLTHPWVAGDNDTPGESLRVYAQLTIAGQINEVEVTTVTVIPR